MLIDKKLFEVLVESFDELKSNGFRFNPWMFIAFILAISVIGFAWRH